MVIVGIFLNAELRTGGNRRYLELMDGLARRGNAVYVVMNASFPAREFAFKRLDIPAPYRRGALTPVSVSFTRAVRRGIGAVRDALGAGGCGDADWVLIHGDAHLGAAVFLARRLRARLFFAYRCNDVRRAGILRRHGGFSPLARAISLAREANDRLRERVVSRESSVVAFQNGADAADYERRVGVLSGRLKSGRLKSGRVSARTVIIPGNIGPPRCSDEWKNANSSRSVSSLVYVGSLDESKGFRQLAEACAVLKARGLGDLRVSALGTADDESRARDLVDSLSVGDMISFEGYANPFPYFASRDLLVYPSLYDAFPDVILESLHAGCPAVASAVGGIPEMLESDELLFEAGNPASIADAVERCVRDPSHYMRLRELCAARADFYRFDWVERWEAAMANATEIEDGGKICRL